MTTELERIWEHRRLDPYGEFSGQAAEGIRKSGLLGEVNSIGQQISTVAAVVDWALPAIITELARNSALLSELVAATTNPRSIAASESARMGAKAFRHGWYRDAIEEFGRAIADNRYDATVHLGMGTAHAALQNYEAAGASFTHAARYGLADNPEVACGAALLGAQALRRAGNEMEATDLLRYIAETVPSCPEVSLAYARATGSDSHLQGALRIAPDLAPTAALADVDGVEEVSRTLLNGSKGLRARLKEELACLTALARIDPAVEDGGIDLRSANHEAYSIQLARTASTVSVVTDRLRSERDRVVREVEHAQREASHQLDTARTLLSSATRRQRTEATGRNWAVVNLTGVVVTTILALYAYVASLDPVANAWGDFAVLLGIVALVWAYFSIGGSVIAISVVMKSRAAKEMFAARRSIEQLEPKIDCLRVRRAEIERLSRRIDRAVAAWPAARIRPFYFRDQRPMRPVA